MFSHYNIFCKRLNFMQYWHFQYFQPILHKMVPLTLLSPMLCNSLAKHRVLWHPAFVFKSHCFKVKKTEKPGASHSFMGRLKRRVNKSTRGYIQGLFSLCVSVLWENSGPFSASSACLPTPVFGTLVKHLECSIRLF